MQCKKIKACENVKDPEDVKEVKSIAHSNDQFSSRLYNLMMKNSQNLVFSPFSISAVMAMLSRGARGQTLKQITDVLSFPPASTLLSGYQTTILALSSTKDFTLETANKVFVKMGFYIRKEFWNTLSNIFHSSIKNMNFGDSLAATNEINDWVEKKTGHKIKDLIQPTMINEDTCLVLVTAIYFKSNWAKKFEKTVSRKFQISPSSSVEVPMMMKSDTVFNAQLDTLSSTMVELPYKGDRIVMQVLLPNTKFGLDDLEEKLKDVDINEIFKKEKKNTTLIIELPKFKLEKTLQLNQHLKKLGLKDMFSESANFSGISYGGGLYVSHVVQKAFIEVDEEGTEAAAANAMIVTMEKSDLISIIPEFMADHPFIFYIRDMESDMLLFQGRVINPLK